MIFLFNASLADYEYDFFVAIDMSFIGKLYLTLYLILTFVLMLNFLISLLANVYTDFSDQSNYYFFNRIVYIRIK